MTDLVADKPSLLTKLAYGTGAAAFGIKNNGFDYFLLLFYGTVIGLEPGLVGLAILIALIFDALSDPLVGYWSDNFHSRWGRRHPFMYASAIPVAVSYFLIWNPPDWGQWELFLYVTVLAVMIRTFITFYETPSSALMPELTRNYEQRTVLQSYRLYFGWTGGNLMSVLMFGVLLAPTAANPEGILNRDAYATYGIIASGMIFLTILISAVGTHNRIPALGKPPEKRAMSPRILFAEMVETLRDKSFFALFWASLFGAIATGLAAALSFLMLTYFWAFSELQIFGWTIAVFFSAILGFVIAPFAVKRMGKKRAAIIVGIVAFAVQPLPVILRLFEIMPENGDPLLYPMVLAINMIDLGFIIALQAIVYSMIADCVEESELRTGRRSEGVFYAAVTFTRKATQGFGALAAGLILSAIAFPQGAAQSAVAPETLWWLGALYAPSLLLLWTAMLISIGAYKIDKSGHEDNLRQLAEAQ
ncbi:MFS transporter [Altererythrobacter sp.]|nr:MFS transporter [Altererythrobacter sp.]